MNNEAIKVEIMERLKWLNRFHMYDKKLLLDAMKEAYGESVIETVEKAEAEKGCSEWSRIADKVGDHSIEAFIKLFWEPLREKGFEFTSENTANGIKMKCTKCPVYEIARDIHAEEWMYHHTCCADAAIAKGFNPDIKMKRTKTIMQGDEYCDHYYYLEETSKS